MRLSLDQNDRSLRQSCSIVRTLLLPCSSGTFTFLFQQLFCQEGLFLICAHEFDANPIKPIELDRLAIHIVDGMRLGSYDWIAPPISRGGSFGFPHRGDSMAALYIVAGRHAFRVLAKLVQQG